MRLGSGDVNLSEHVVFLVDEGQHVRHLVELAEAAVAARNIGDEISQDQESTGCGGAAQVSLAGGVVAATLFGAEHRLMTAAPRTSKIELLGNKMPKVLEGVTKGLVLRFKSKPGKEAEVAQMMRDCQPLVEKEAGTLAWFANQYDASHFGTFAVFADNGSRFAHLTGQIPRALGMTGLSLLGGAPEVHMVDVMTGTARQGD